MNFKSEKGITGIDITVSVIILTIFVSIITTLFYSIQVTSADVERRTQATYQAIDAIEKLKVTKFSDLESKNLEGYGYIDDNGSWVESDTPFYTKITIEDYVDLSGDTTKIRGLVKKVTVKVSYKSGKETKDVEISTIRTKEN